MVRILIWFHMDYCYTYNYKLVPIEGWRRATVYQCHVLRCTWSIYHFRRAKPNTVRRLRKTMRTGRQLFTHHRRSWVKFSTLSVSILTGSSLEVNCFGVITSEVNCFGVIRSGWSVSSYILSLKQGIVVVRWIINTFDFFFWGHTFALVHPLMHVLIDVHYLPYINTDNNVHK